MFRKLKVLGDGQIWDIRGFSAECPGMILEDLFSGRALGRLAKDFDARLPAGKKIFASFKEKGQVSGLSVTRALLSGKNHAVSAARAVLDQLAENGACGIAALSKGRARKENWPVLARNYWNNIDYVIIGGGVSEEATGRFLVGAIKKYLRRYGLGNIPVYQAGFPGKESGFLGAVVNILPEINPAAGRRLAVVGLDLGRSDIGVGLVLAAPRTGKILQIQGKRWVFARSVSTPRKDRLKLFMDRRRDYSARERILGERIRGQILEAMADLALQAKGRAEKSGFSCSEKIGVAVPGAVSPDGAVLDSTDYLPFFRRKEGFNFSRELTRLLVRRGWKDAQVRLVNDGIAAGIANAYLAPAPRHGGKFAFFGVGSGLGGCVGIVEGK